MMQDDFLKKYIDENRDSFDDIELPSGMFAEIMQKKKHRKVVRNRRLYVYAAAAACALLIVSSVFLLQNDKPEKAAVYTSSFTMATQPASVEPNKKNDTVSPDAISLAKPSPAPIVKGKASEKSPSGVVDLKTASGITGANNEYAKMMAELEEGTSVAKKMNAIYNAADHGIADEKVTQTIRNLFAGDENSNVRLAALHVLAGQVSDSITRSYLIEGLVNEKDPVIQMELIRIMRSDEDSAVTEKLVQMAGYPFTIQEVKDQVYYTLLAR